MIGFFQKDGESMIANHVHDALEQVKRLQQVILEKRLFRGYSGTARVIGGAAAIAGSVVMSSAKFPASPIAHLVGWACVLSVGLVVNYGALAVWFFFDKEAKREFLKLVPAMDAIPPLAIGAVLSLALFLHQEYDLLFGTWMCLYGLAHMSYRLSLPTANYIVGIFYIVAGAFCLVLPGVTFTNPWPMGIIFCTGETIGGFVLHKHRLKLAQAETEE
jgi:hypothetical protein